MMTEYNIDRCIRGIKTTMKSPGRMGSIPAMFRRESGIGSVGTEVLMSLTPEGVLVTPYNPNKSGHKGRIDLFGRLSSIPLEFRESLGINYPQAEVEMILLKDGILLRAATSE